MVSEIEQLRSQLDDARRQIAALQGVVGRKDVALENVHANHRETRRQLADLKEELNLVSEQRDGLAADADSLAAEANDARRQLERLEKALAYFPEAIRVAFIPAGWRNP
jgi:chromosome segregation ATPase